MKTKKINEYIKSNKVPEDIKDILIKYKKVLFYLIINTLSFVLYAITVFCLQFFNYESLFVSTIFLFFSIGCYSLIIELSHKETQIMIKLIKYNKNNIEDFINEN